MTFIFIEAVGAEGIPATKKTQPDTYLVISVGSAVNSQKTRTFERSNRPEWKHQFAFILPSICESMIKCILFNYDDFSKDESISQLILTSGDFEYGKIYDDFYPMEATKGHMKGGLLHLRIQIGPRNHVPFTPFTGKIPKSAIREMHEGDHKEDVLPENNEKSKETSENKPKTNENKNKNKNKNQKEKEKGQENAGATTNATVTTTQSIESSQTVTQATINGQSFTIPLPNFEQAGMPNGYQAVVYIMPTNETPNKQTTWRIMNPATNEMQQNLSLTSPTGFQTAATIQALSQTQPIVIQKEEQVPQPTKQPAKKSKSSLKK